MLFHATATFETAAQRGVTRKAIVPRRELTERTEEKRRVEGARGKKKRRKGRFRRCKPSAIFEGRARGPERRVARFIASESHHCDRRFSLFLSPSGFGYTTAPSVAFADSFIGISLVPSFPLSALYPACPPLFLLSLFSPAADFLSPCVKYSRGCTLPPNATDFCERKRTQS